MELAQWLTVIIWGMSGMRNNGKITWIAFGTLDGIGFTKWIVEL